MARYAVVLAAGRGERMWPLSSSRPKALLPLPQGTLLSRILLSLWGLVEGAVVVVSPEWEHWVRGYVEGGSWGFPVGVAVQEEPRGTADALRAGVGALPRRADQVLVVYGDAFFGDTMVYERVAELEAGLAGVRVENPERYGVLFLDQRGCLERVVEKPRGLREGVVNAGVFSLPRSLLEEALEETPVSPRGELEVTDTLTIMASRGLCIRVAGYDGFWRDVGTPWDYMDAVGYLLEGLGGGSVEGEVEPGAVIRGPVHVSSGAVVRTGSVVEGPAWIEGEVGPLAHVRPYTMVLEGAVVGAFSQVKASILLEGARAPHLNYVGDSILGEGSNMGAGSVTANLRFDKRNVRVTLKGVRVDTGRRKLGSFLGAGAQVGVNASLMPGIRVGAGAWVEAGMTLYQDVPDCSFARVRGGSLELRRVEGCTPPKTLTKRY